MRADLDEALGFPRSVEFEPPDDVSDGYAAYTIAAVAPLPASSAALTL